MRQEVAHPATGPFSCQPLLVDEDFQAVLQSPSGRPIVQYICDLRRGHALGPSPHRRFDCVRPSRECALPRWRSKLRFDPRRKITVLGADINPTRSFPCAWTLVLSVHVRPRAQPAIRCDGHETPDEGRSVRNAVTVSRPCPARRRSPGRWHRPRGQRGHRAGRSRRRCRACHVLSPAGAPKRGT